MLEVDLEQADKRVANGAQMVDVREKDEWDEAHLPGTIHNPLDQVAQRAGELDSNREVVAICRSGNRSKTAVQIVKQSGFSDASSIAGGMIAWDRAGKPIER